ncbi:MFS transporter [Rhizomonospora bruguierae]|uniref:MFS transporter n=1 Tax=Rhizomonospora bruguierae TaxID=1581705 RepID=UPI001BCDC88A|nr:MFS transporter [Micromonospora sp. NBRC 107566]
MSDTFAPLRHAPFRNLAIGTFVTRLGNGVAPIALAFAVLDLTGSVRDLGLVVGARSLCNVLFLLYGGVIADRLPRHRVILLTGVMAAVTQGAVATLVLTHTASIGTLMALGAVNGIVTAFELPAASALIPQTLPAGLLQQANALNRFGINGAMIGGASLGGILVAAVGPGWGLAADAATFALGAALFARIRLTAPAERPRARGNPLGELRVGWTEFRSRTWLWVVVVAFTFMNAAWVGAVGVVGPSLADASIGRGAWGVVLAGQTAGMLVGALVAMRLRIRRLLFVGCACMLGWVPFLVALAEAPVLVVLLPAAFLGGLAVEQFGVAWETTMQRHIPADKLARVYSYDMLGSFIAIPLGQVVAGPVALAAGDAAAVLGAAGIVLAGTLFMLASRDVRQLVIEPAPAPEPPAAAPADPEATGEPAASEAAAPR